MSASNNPVRTTIVGGLIFLLPFVVVVLIVGKAFSLMRAIAQPVAVALGIDRIGAFAVIDLLAILLLLGICYLAGLVATSGRGRNLHRTFDARLLDMFPRYGFIKSLTESLGGDGSQQTLKVVLVHFDDQSQLGFEVERSDTRVVVYLPGSPDPWSGAVCFVEPARVKPLDVDFRTAVKSLRLVGRGAVGLA